jgi:site-specific recombinase XerC
MSNTVNRSILDGECITIFRAAVRSKFTFDPYERRLIAFLSEIGMKCNEFVELAKANPAAVEKMVIDFVLKEKNWLEQGSIASSTIGNKLKPIKLLLEMNDAIGLNWKKIKRLLPSPRRFALDRIPTMEEIHRIMEHSDLRGKALTLVLCSSGIREGAIENLTVRNLKPLRIGSQEPDGSRQIRTFSMYSLFRSIFSSS